MKHVHAELMNQYAEDSSLIVEFLDKQPFYTSKWRPVTCPSWHPEFKYRIKSAPKPDMVKSTHISTNCMKTPHKHAELIKAWADGATIEHLTAYDGWEILHHPVWTSTAQYRIKPELKPDVIKFVHFSQKNGYNLFIDVSSDHNWSETSKPSYTLPVNAKLTFDGETDTLKSVEMIK